MITVTKLTGSSIRAIIPELAKLRIAIFREYPYLYEGSAEYEEKYLHRYSESEQCIVVLVQDGSQIVGASTGMPLADEAPEVVNPVRNADYDIRQCFYFAESVLMPQYRKRRLGHRFFTERINHAFDYGYELACFCSVVRPDDHPLRPADYRPLNDFWAKQGFRKLDGVTTTFSWKEFGEDTESAKPMEFWMRKL